VTYDGPTWVTRTAFALVRTGSTATFRTFLALGLNGENNLRIADQNCRPGAIDLNGHPFWTGTHAMTTQLQIRFWIDTTLGVISALTLLMTVAAPDWIERIFGLWPDGGTGWTEWQLSIVLVLATIVFFADARRVRACSTQ
jgi:hypothetical protein